MLKYFNNVDYEFFERVKYFKVKCNPIIVESTSLGRIFCRIYNKFKYCKDFE